MGLTTCTACQGQLSSSARKCPHCGHPMKRKSTAASALVGAAVVLGFAGFTYRYVLTPEEKQNFNLAAATAGVPVTPWADRAEAVARTILESNGEKIASAVLAATHPTGEKARLGSTAFSREGDLVACSIQVSWSGGLLGTPYVTTVVWRFSERGHVSASLSRDTAQIAASPSAPGLLEEYFATKVWPAVAESVRP